MRPFPLLAAALILVPLAARADDGVQGKAAYSISGCQTDKDIKTLSDNIERAAKKAGSCLKGINAGLAEKIVKGYAGWDYSCAYKTSIEGGKTEFHNKGRAVVPSIEMAFKTSGEQYTFEARLFHEMLHAVDSRYQLINASAHGQKGATDAVYGCQLACYPGEIGETELKMYLKAGSAVPEPPKDYNPKSLVDADSQYLMDTDHVWAAQTYAAICAAGKPFFNTKSLDKTCLAQKISDGCPQAQKDKAYCDGAAAGKSAYCRLRCDHDDEDSVAKEAKDSAAAIVAALKDKQGLSGEPAALLKQLKADKSLEACNK